MSGRKTPLPGQQTCCGYVTFKSMGTTVHSHMHSLQWLVVQSLEPARPGFKATYQLCDFRPSPNIFKLQFLSENQGHSGIYFLSEIARMERKHKHIAHPSALARSESPAHVCFLHAVFSPSSICSTSIPGSQQAAEHQHRYE